jgi:hypothetical protein
VFIRYQEYLRWKVNSDDDASRKQCKLSSFVTVGDPVYSTRHPRQTAITNSIVSDLVVQCSLPLSLVENVHFRHFLRVMDPKYTPVARSTLSAKMIPHLVETTKARLSEQLENVSYVSITVDIWTDRRMRAYFGCTVHFIDHNKMTEPILSSSLLCCERFMGSHTGEKIAEFLLKLVDEYKIKHKIMFVLSDNAANMRKAFRLAFPETQETDAGSEEDDDSGETDADNSEIWNDLDEQNQSEIESALNSLSTTRRLACFAHTEQLVVSDGLKETRSMRSLIAKCSKLSTMLHTSSTFKDKFEATFGAQASIPSDNVTRWHSTLRQLKSIVELGQQKLAGVLRDCGHDNLLFTSKESAQLEELVCVLSPFKEATDLTQGAHKI